MTTLSVKKLNRDLAQLQTLRTNEKKALATVKAQEKQVIDAFSANPSLTGFLSAATKLISLGMKEQQTHDRFDPAIAKEKKTALTDLKKAAPSLSLHELNHDRALLGLKPLAHQPQPPAPAYGQPWHKNSHGQLGGSDTSHYQSKATFERAIAHSQFAAIKATEGTSYTDPTFKARWAELGKKIDQGKMSLRVAYLFLDKGNGVGQAKHFLNTLGIHGKLKPGTRLALDWEASALSSPQTLKDAANYIHKVTGLWPMVYTSASRVAQARQVVPNAPMWEAKWTNGRADHNVPFVQYSDGPGYDHDVFNGSLADLRKFAGF
ncbi:MAG: GH25 family lysozyme [Myxococcaceae bacterium]